MNRNLGVIAPVPKDNWNSATAYKALSIVKYNNALYMAKSDVSAGVVPTNTTYWSLLISQASVDGAVTYSAQSVSDGEKQQARTNIGAAGETVLETNVEHQSAYMGFGFNEWSVWFVTMETGGTLGIYEKTTSEAEWVEKGTITSDTTAIYIITKRGNWFYITNLVSGGVQSFGVTLHAYRIEIGLTNCPYGQIIKLGG